MPSSDHNLNLLVEVARRMGEPSELDALLETIEQAVRSALDCERAAIFLYDRQNDELYSTIATGVNEIRFPADQGIAGAVARAREVVIVQDAYADQRFNREVDVKTGFRTRNLLTLPMVASDGDLLGVLQVLNKKSGEFTPDDEALASALGALTGIALKRQLLMDAMAEKKRLDQALAAARDIQQSLLPAGDPQLDGYDIAGWSEAAEATGGDCYDFRWLDDGRLMLMIADATGHGMGPALIVAQCRAMIRAVFMAEDELVPIVRQVNELLCEDLPGDRFVTSCFGLLDAEADQLEYISAGQGPLLLFRKGGSEVHTFGADNIPLGILTEVPIEPGRTIQFEPGDLFVWLTDGFVEWADRDGELYGVDRLIACVQRHRHLPSREIIQHIRTDVIGFARGTTQSDDLTAVVIKRLNETE